MRKLIFICLFLLSGLTLTSAQIALSFNPKKGSKYEYQTKTIQMVKQSFMGQEMPMETGMSMSYIMDVKEKNHEGSMVQYTYRNISYTVSSPMMKMGYDSENPVENPTELDQILEKMFGSLIGKPFEVRIAPDGSVISLTGMDAIAESMVQSASSENQMGAQIAASMKQQFNDAAMKDMFEQSLKIYPAGTVKPGDSWNTEQALSISGMMNMTTKIKYTLTEVKKNAAAVAMESTINMKPGMNMEGDLTGTQTGTMQVDIKTGMPVSTEITQNIKGSIKAQGIDILMDMTSKIKTSIKEIN